MTIDRRRRAPEWAPLPASDAVPCLGCLDHRAADRAARRPLRPARWAVWRLVGTRTTYCHGCRAEFGNGSALPTPDRKDS